MMWSMYKGKGRPVTYWIRYEDGSLECYDAARTKQTIWVLLKGWLISKLG